MSNEKIAEAGIDLVRRFSGSYDEEAGAHFTSRDIIYLMTDIPLLVSQTQIGIWARAEKSDNKEFYINM